MPIILNNESIVPFLGERLSFVKGLDPLGLQNTSDATFTKLLPGLNNVTGRIRYYSFYSWLLDAYSKEVGSTNPKDQKQFIRRAEYIIALLSQYIEGDYSSIPGSNYAAAEVNNNTSSKYDLQKATYKPDGSTRDTYWNFPSGAFGQYYLGSLRDIGIIIERENQVGIFIRTAKKNYESISGEDLAEAFGENIPKIKQKLFLDYIRFGAITEEQILQLLPEFNLTILPSGSREQIILKELLLQKDFPLIIEGTSSTLRKQTIKHILEFLSIKKENFLDRIFVYHCYNVKGEDKDLQDECLTGWYYYQVNEFWQYACTSILNGTLGYLYKEVGPNWMSLTKLVEDVTQKVISDYKLQNLIQSENELATEMLIKLPQNQNEYSYFNSTSKSELTSKIASAFLLIFKIYLNNQHQLQTLKIYSENNDLAKDGEGVSYFFSQFSNDKNKSISKFIYDFIYAKIIYRHQYVAFRKIGNGSLSTQKFIIEDQHIRYLGNFDAGYTGPRIGRLVGFLKDLEILTSDNTLTNAGETLLKSFTTKDDPKT